MAHYRFIVSREHEPLFNHLVRSLADLEDVEVILDRRIESAREKPRGQAERRIHARVQEELRTFGWAFIHISPNRRAAPSSRGGG